MLPLIEPTANQYVCARPIVDSSNDVLSKTPLDWILTKLRYAVSVNASPLSVATSKRLSIHPWKGAIGALLGSEDGTADGPDDDTPDGDPVTLGWMLRLSEGDAVAVGCSLEVGNSDPIEVGMLDGDEFGLLLALGLFVGPIVGSELGFVVGTADSVG